MFFRDLPLFHSCREVLISASLSLPMTELLRGILVPSTTSLEEQSGEVLPTLEKDMLTCSFSNFRSFRL